MSMQDAQRQPKTMPRRTSSSSAVSEQGEGGRPFNLVWVPIPILTHLLPFIGHVGICTSTGRTLDFAGPYYVSLDEMAFGAPTRFLRLDPSHMGNCASDTGSLAEVWDGHLQHAAQAYRHKMYNFLGTNCHAFVVDALNGMAYKHSRGWHQVHVAALVFFRGRWVSLMACVFQLLPSVVLITTGTLLAGLKFLYAYIAVMLVIVLLSGVSLAVSACRRRRDPKP